MYSLARSLLFKLDAENHGFVQVVAVIFEQCGHYAAFAVGGMLVWEFGHGVSIGYLFGSVFIVD